LEAVGTKFKPMNTLGVIGGIGQESTIDYRAILTAYRAKDLASLTAYLVWEGSSTSGCKARG
jgi:aspartate/glutamate racemase